MADPENQVPTIRQYPLERVKIIKKFIASEIGYLILFAIIIIFGWGVFAGMGLLIPALLALGVLFLILSAVNYWYQTAYYSSCYYDIRQRFLVIKKGVFMPRETVLPFEKLQDVYIDQDIYDRMFGIWDLHVSTATLMSGAEAHIDGVSLQNGEAMKEILLEKIQGKG